MPRAAGRRGGGAARSRRKPAESPEACGVAGTFRRPRSVAATSVLGTQQLGAGRSILRAPTWSAGTIWVIDRTAGVVVLGLLTKWGPTSVNVSPATKVRVVHPSSRVAEPDFTVAAT